MDKVLYLGRTNYVLSPVDVGDSNFETEYSTDDTIDTMFFNNSLNQIMKSSNSTYSGTRRNKEFNTKTKTDMETIPCTDGLYYNTVTSSSSDNFTVV